MRRLLLLPLRRARFGPGGDGDAAAAFRASSAALGRRLRAGGVAVLPAFVSEEEEALLVRELEPQLRRRRYQDAHWDGVGVQAAYLA